MDPWRSLHPSGHVGSLSEALRGQFDAFYKEQAKVSFDRCELGYIKDAEGPQEYQVFGDKFGYDETEQKPLFNPDWSSWV